MRPDSDSILVLPPRLAPSLDYYVHAWRYGNYVQDWCQRFDKRVKGAHRFVIADTHGPLQLTVPIAKPDSSSCRWDDIYISTHGAWWDVHRVALESAYGRTPYFEFYIDRFLPMLTVGVDSRFPKLSSLALAWDAEIRSILTFPPSPGENSATHSTIVEHAEDTSTVVNDAIPTYPPYYQVRADKLGFISDLSILDLIFNLGPESPLYLDSISR